MVSDSQVIQSPLFSADHRYLEEILAEAESKLRAITPTAESYRSKLPALPTAVADVLHHINEALAVLESPHNYLISED